MLNVDGARFVPGDAAGHYESYFLRANHPTRPLSFWIRYTVFSPKGRPQDAIGELWAVVADRERNLNLGVKAEVPIAQCRFDRDRLDVQIADATLKDQRFQGSARIGAHEIRWYLRFDGGASPLLFLPEKLYAARLPKAKSLVILPMAHFSGLIVVDERWIEITDWIGSVNHNWGSKHTDRYAYAQVCGFDNAPDSFLEVASARVKLGPIWSPQMTPVVLRHRGEEFALNSLRQSVRAQAGYRDFFWAFVSENERVRVDGAIRGRREEFVGLRYYNPPGGVKTCLNSKLADCHLKVIDRKTGKTEELFATQRTAFEILTDGDAQGVAVQA
ncbi:MAG TPA: hypothetical protein VFB36_09360 [Nevskiaceae bacterium]|nr:hypothetical protein [Nevskiaceae bacterium]